MQACRLSLAEAPAHPSQVAKALLDAPSHCAALLLADSSCLLLPSLSALSPPLRIPPSCTDACFLRLRPSSSSSSSSESSSSSSSDRSPATSGLLAPDDPKKSTPGKCKSATEKLPDDPMSRHPPRDDPLFFLVAMPGRGGSCTELTAWSCAMPAFLPTPIRSEGCVNRTIDHVSAAASTVVQLDVPHGVSVKIAASVNVVVVYSPSVSKVWIMSVRFSQARRMEPCSTTSARNPGSAEFVEGSHKAAEATYSKEGAKMRLSSCHLTGDRKQKEKDKQGSLHLITCAVLDCNGPVFALHLSWQHLLLGQLGGLRVWALRPLIKGRKVPKRDQRAEVIDSGKGTCIGKGAMACERTKPADNGESGKKVSDRSSESTDGRRNGYRKETQTKAPSFFKAQSKNGFYEVEGFGNSIGNLKSGKESGASVDGGKGQIGGETAFMKTKEGEDLSGNSLNGCLKAVLCDSDSWESRPCVGVTEMGIGTLDLQHEIWSASKLAQEVPLEHVTFLERRIGMLPYDSEDCLSQHVLSQSSMLSSASGFSCCNVSATASHSEQTASGACSSSCYLLGSSSSSFDAATFNASLSEISGGLPLKGGQDGVFVPFQSAKVQDKRVKQAISVQGLSEREIVVLDSSGNLHLVTLQQSEKNVCEQEGRRVSVNASSQLLTCSMRVKMLTALPVSLQCTAAITHSASRILLISDGGHTVYIVTLPARELSEERKGKRFLEPSHLTVIQTIFTSDRVRSLSALSTNAAMVLTEGSMFVYSMVGT